MRLKFIVLLSLLTLIAAHSRADVIVPKDTVTGIVIGKNKEPLPGAKVEIVGQPYSAFTDLDGRFNIKCERGAKKVLVSYPKARDVKKKIVPDMTVQIGRSWRQVPERYQWFVGANIGVGYTFNDIDISDDIWYEEEFWSPTLSVMVGRVKAVGWYLKGFVNFPSKGTNCWIDEWDNNGDYYYDIASSGIKTRTSGAILGGMVRLGCPLHLYLGVGYAYSTLEGAKELLNLDYHHLGFCGDVGMLFRIKNNFGINLSMNISVTENSDIAHGSFLNLGFDYFFNK